MTEVNSQNGQDPEIQAQYRAESGDSVDAASHVPGILDIALPDVIPPADTTAAPRALDPLVPADRSVMDDIVRLLDVRRG